MAKKPQQRAKRTVKVTVENGASAHTGTHRADYTNAPSCEHSQPKHNIKGTWGGDRNSALRKSESLTDKQVASLMESARYAFVTGRIFQRHWTVHYGKVGVRPQDGARFVSRLLGMVSKQARREGGELTALWVRECASDKGEHVHILMHLPADMRLHGRTRRWIMAAGGTWQPGISKVRIIGGRLSKLERSREPSQQHNAANVTRYLLKAADEETGAKLDLRRSNQGGRIIGKRCGWTQNIGNAAREGVVESLKPEGQQAVGILD